MTFPANAHGTRRHDSKDSILLSLTETRGRKGMYIEGNAFYRLCRPTVMLSEWC